VPKGSFRHRIARGAFWTLAASGFGQSLTFLAFLAVARILGQKTFGEWGAVQTTLGLFGVLAGLGLPLTTTKFIAEYRATDSARCARIYSLLSAVTIVSGALISLAFASTACWISNSVMHNSHLEGPLRLASVLLLLYAIDSNQIAALGGFEAFRGTALVSLVKGSVTFPVLLIGAWGWQLEGAICGSIISSVLGLSLNHLTLRRVAIKSGVDLRSSIPLTEAWRERRMLFDFSLPALLQGSVQAPAEWACSMLLVALPGGYEQMGIYTAANRLQKLVTFALAPVGSIALPLLSNLTAKGDILRYRKFFRGHIILNAGLSSLCAIAFTIGSPWIMMSFGSEYRDGWPVLALLAVSNVFTMTATTLGFVMQSWGHMWTAFAVNFIRALSLTIAFWMLQNMGAVGWGVATVMAAAIQFLAVWVYYISVIKNAFLAAGSMGETAI